MRTPIIPLFAAALLSLAPFAANAQEYGYFSVDPTIPHIGQPFGFAFQCFGDNATYTYDVQLTTGTAPLVSGQAVCPIAYGPGPLPMVYAHGRAPGLPAGNYVVEWQPAGAPEGPNSSYADFTVAGAQPIVPLLYYSIINVGKSSLPTNPSAKACLDAPSGYTANGNVIELENCLNDFFSQEWMFIPTDSGYYTVTNRNIQIDPNNPLNEYPIDLDVANEATANGSFVHLWQNLFLPNQQWKPVLLSDGNFTLVGRGSQRCLDGSVGDQAPLLIMDCNGSPEQKWNLVPELSQK